LLPWTEPDLSIEAGLRASQNHSTCPPWLHNRARLPSSAVLQRPELLELLQRLDINTMYFVIPANPGHASSPPRYSKVAADPLSNRWCPPETPLPTANAPRPKILHSTPKTLQPFPLTTTVAKTGAKGKAAGAGAKLHTITSPSSTLSARTPACAQAEAWQSTTDPALETHLIQRRSCRLTTANW
jgi:hypothetical protein